MAGAAAGGPAGRRAGPRAGARHARFELAHIESSDTSVGSSDYLAFYRDADKRFVQRASGRADVPARGLLKHWIHTGRGVNDFILRIEPADLPRMEPGVAYQLDWQGAERTRRWTVAEAATLTR